MLFKFAGTDADRDAADRLKFLLYVYSPRAGGAGDVVLLGRFGVTTRGRIWDGGELGRDAESAEGRRGFGESIEGRLTF